MTDTTNIQITTEQKEKLDGLKRYDGESYKSVIAGLLARDRERESRVTYDDVEAACAAAIREELPVERMGGR